jgi:hypothetical protein
VKSKEVKTRCGLAESSEEGCDSKRAVMPIMMLLKGHVLEISSFKLHGIID